MSMTEQEEYEYLILKKKKAMSIGQINQQQTQPKPSMATMGGSYLTKHPFKAAFNDPVETATGKSMLERSQSSSVFSKPPSNPLEFLGEFGAGLTRDTGALIAGSAASPASLATMGIGAIPMAGKTVAQVAGKAIAGSKAGQAAGKVLNAEIEPLIQNAWRAAKGGVKGVSNKFGEILQVGKNLKGVQSKIVNVESRISNIPQKSLQLKTETQNIRYKTKSEISNLETNFTKLDKALKDTLHKETIAESGMNKQKLNKLFKDMTATYRRGLDEAEDVLAQQGKSITSDDYLNNVVNRTIEELKNKALPEDNAAFSAINKLKDSLSESKNMSLSELKNLKNSIYDKIQSGVKSGSRYASADDEVANVFLKNHGEYIGNMSPELATLNSEFAPMANSRGWAMRNFKPYSEKDIQKGADVLKRLATKENPNQTDLNHLMQLEQGSGRFKGAGNLRGNVEEAGKSIKLNKQSFDSAKKNLIDSTDYKLRQLEIKKANLEKGKINLGFQRDKLNKIEKDLKSLRDLRNKIIGYTIITTIGTGVGSRIIRDVTTH